MKSKRAEGYVSTCVMIVITMAHMADSKEQLDADTETILSMAPWLSVKGGFYA